MMTRGKANGTALSVTGEDERSTAPDTSIEHKSKRVKREHIVEEDEDQGGQDTKDCPSGNVTQNNGDGLAVCDIEALATEAAIAVMAGAESQNGENGKADDDVMNEESQNGENSKADDNVTNKESQTGGLIVPGDRCDDPTFAATPNVDFSSAPSDPIELALWVAKQISNFQQIGRNSTGVADRLRSLTHPPALYTRRFYEDDDPLKAAERERQREENRERKKRWRESNAERNKDNDLRCRINKRAKQIWGSNRPAERSVWMEAEFNKRRAKRESKDRYRYFGDGFSGFPFGSELGSSLFPTPGVGPQGETNAAGLLLANVLLGAGSDGHGPNAGAADALKRALSMSTADPRHFTEALRAMAANAEVMNGINAVLGASSGYEDAEFNSGDEDVVGSVLGREAQAELMKRESNLDEGIGKESEIVEALNAATAMLNKMNAARGEDVAREGQGDVEDVNEVGRTERVGSVGAVEERSSGGEGSTKEQGLDQAQIAALLAMTDNGTALQDMSSNELSEGQVNEGPSDSDISSTLQKIMQDVTARRREHASLSSEEQWRIQLQSSSSSLSSTQQRQPSNRARARNMTLSSLLQCAGLSTINTLIPAAQSQATSQLYARLSDNHPHRHHHQPAQVRASPEASRGGVNPAHASAYGNTMELNRRLLARPNAFSRPLHRMEGNVVLAAGGGRKRSAEEEWKIRSFGYPPFPGERIGQR